MHDILVTGGAGFIGAHLCRRLLKEGNRVICMDNLFSGSLDHIRDLLDNPGFTVVHHDVTEPFDFPVDRIYDLACPASPVFYQRDPVHTAKTSVFGAIHSLELARKTRARVLLTSTSEIYGEPMVHPQREDYRGNVNPIGIRSCYDEGKRMAETLFFDYNREYGVDIRVVRIFNTYGPGMSPDDGRVVSNFIVQALNGEDLTIYGDGSQTRSFCYISDTVDALIRMMEQERTLGPINVGNPREVTIQHIAELVREEVGADIHLVHRELPSDDPTRRRPDISRAQEFLGWEPRIPLEEGLRSTVAYFREKQKTVQTV